MEWSEQKKHVCCFLGHREMCATDAIKCQLTVLIEELIIKEQVRIFLFGSKSRFNDLCYEVVTEMKIKYPYIKRIYIRAEFPYITDNYRSYLLEKYEDTYFPENLMGAGRAVYVRRNYLMINNSLHCVFYCNETYAPKERKSGTKLALDYAEKAKKMIYRITE